MKFETIYQAASGLFGKIVILDENNELIFEDTKELLTESQNEAAKVHFDKINKELDIALSLQTSLLEAKAYLEATDFKVLPDYDEDATEVKLKRKEAREFIRANEVKELK